MQVVDVNGNMFGYDHLEIIGADGRPKTLDSGLTSVGLSMPSAFTVSNSPLTSNGTIGVTGAGTTSQYIDGTGSLRSFPSLTGYVPYVGATQNVDLGEYQLKAGQIEFDQTPTGTPGVAIMRWNDQDGTVDLGLKGGNVTLQIGQEQLTRVVNKTGGNLLEANYQSVRISGAQGNRLKVALAQANNDANSAETLGIVTETINDNQEGFITTSGLVRNINTTGSLQGETWADGDMLYLSGTVAGQLTNIKPTAPIHTVIMGYVVRAHATQGQIYVKVDNGYELDELHNVAISSPLNNQGLFYETATQLWKNKSIDTALGYTPVPTTRQLTINGTTYDLSANRTWLVGTVTSVTASAPLSSSGGTTPNITISQASSTDDGYLSAADWTTFNSKQPAGNYITALIGEASAIGPGTASVTLNNASVTAKVLTGVNITGGSINASDSILTAFGKLQNQINGLVGSSIYQGVWNASTNTPALASGVGTRGYYYIVNVAGSTNLDGITDWNVGDWAIFDGTAWQQVDNTDSVTSVNGQTGAVSLTTDNIPEGATNLYFTQLRARQSLSLTTSGSSGAATYSSTTGVLNIPNYSTALSGYVPTSRRLEINGVSYDLSADRSWSVGTVTSVATTGPLTGGTITSSGTIGITQATPFTDGYLSYIDWNTFNNKQNAITLTTTGTSGAATLIGSTLNIPQYQAALTNPVTGTGATNYVTKWTSVNSVGNSQLFDDGTNVGITTATPSYKLDVLTATAGDSIRLNNTNGTVGSSNYFGYLIAESGVIKVSLRYRRDGSGITELLGVGNAPLILGTNNTERIRIAATGTVLVGTTTAGVNGLLQVNGSIGLAQNTDVRQSTNSDGGTLRFLGTQFVAGITNSQSYNYGGGGLIASVASSDNAVLLDVGRSTSTDARFKISNTTSGNATLSFGTSAASTLYAVTNGNVGIGTSSPSSKLDVAGTISNNSSQNIIYSSYNAVAALFQRVGTYGSIIQIGRRGVSNSATIDYPADGTIAISTVSAERMRINNSGNVGIGTTSPAVKLHVSGTTETIIRVSDTGGSYLDLLQQATNSYLIASNALIFYNGGSERMRITTLGNIGIGTSSPTEYGGYKTLTLDSASGTFTEYRQNGTPIFRMGADGNRPFLYGMTNAPMDFFTNGSLALTITSGGYVGIGTSNPSGKLNISGVTSYNTGLNIDGSSINGVGLSLRNASGNDWYIISTGGNNGGGASNLGFYNDTVGDYRVYFKNNGNVGIGTTSPNKQLTFAQASDDAIQIRRLTTSQGNPSIGTGISWTWSDSSTDNETWAAIRVIMPGSGNSNMTFSTTPVGGGGSGLSERMRITDSGLIGIGTTAPSQKLHVDGNARVTGAYYDSNNQAGTSGQILSSTGSGTDWVDSPTATATSVAQLIPNATVTYNWTGQVIDSTWVNIFSRADNVLTTGTWMVRLYVDDSGQGGQHYDYAYSGTMTWYQYGTNQSGIPAASEIALHRMGHAANSCVIYLRTTEEPASDGGNGKLQIKGNYTNTSNTTITFTFVKII